MPCYQSSGLPSGVATAGRTAYATEAACLEACKEGACCEGTTCSVKPQCQCQGQGKTFKGIGTTCNQYKGACCTGSSCAVVSECECVGTGKKFQGIGTTCSPNPCYCPNAPEGIGRCCGPETVMPVGVPQTYIKCVDGKTKSQCDDIGGVWQERACCDIVGDANVPALVCAGNPLP